MGKSYFIRTELLICFIMFTESASSQSPQWIQSNGCQNVTYGGTVFDLANNSPATCFKACRNTTESVALRFHECACSPLYQGQLVEPANKTNTLKLIMCEANDHTNCGCLLNNISYWTNYQVSTDFIKNVKKQLYNRTSDENQCVAAQQISGQFAFYFESCTTSLSIFCKTGRLRLKYMTGTTQPWAQPRCDYVGDSRISGSELLSQTLAINARIWTDIFVEKAHDPNMVSIMYNSSVESTVGSASYSFDLSTAILQHSTNQRDLSLSQQHVSTFVSPEEYHSAETTANVNDPVLRMKMFDSFGSQLLDSYTPSYEQSATSFTEQTRVLSDTLSIRNLDTSHQSSITHLQTLFPSYTTIIELKPHASDASNININQHVISSTPELIIELQTKPPSTRHTSNSERLSFTVSVIKPTNVQGSSTIELTSRLQEQNPKPEALSGNVSDIKPYVIVIMTAVISGMIGVVTALLLINRTLVASQKEMARMNDILSRKLLEDRRTDTCDKLPVTGVVDNTGTRRMRIWESRPNEYTLSKHNVNDNERRLSMSLNNSDNGIPNRTRSFPKFSFSKRSYLRSYSSDFPSPFRPQPSSD